MASFRIGEFAKSKAGHDKGEIFIIVGAEGEYVFLADGKARTVEKPKKKKIKHIQTINCTDDEILKKIDSNIKIINEDVKRAIKCYKQETGGC